jgi:hypothetical protein
MNPAPRWRGLAATAAANDGSRVSGARLVRRSGPWTYADEKRAYFPVVVGLVFSPPELSPENWSHHERAEFWKALLEAIDAETEKTAKGIKPRRRRTTSARSETSTLEPEVHAVQKGTVEAVFPLAFRRSLMDNEVAAMLSRLHTVSLPVKRWAGLPTLSELEDQEVRRLRDELGDEAERKTADRGPLLYKRTRWAGHLDVPLIRARCEIVSQLRAIS